MSQTFPPLLTRIKGQRHDLGGFSVNRLLPPGAPAPGLGPQRNAVGSFVFFDHFGPARFAPGEGIDIRPHPHIGIATVTYLFEGEIRHCDSLGFDQAIRSGAVNWMTAGRGIVHSERSDPAVRATGGRLHGVQAWVALPREKEEMAPAFDHYPASDLPEVPLSGGGRLRLIAGDYQGVRSPVATASPVFYGEALMEPGARLPLPAALGERALYPVEGRVVLGTDRIEGGDKAALAVLADGPDADVIAETPARLMVLGGAPLDGPRRLWWNFVSSDPERIERAKEDWAAGRFPQVPGDDTRIPLPGA